MKTSSLNMPLEAIDHDIRKLAEAIMVGEILIDRLGTRLSERLSDEEAYVLAREVLEYLLGEECLTLAIKIIGSRRWLETWQATLYSGLGFKELKGLALDHRIKGRKTGPGRTAPWRFCRLSIDHYFESTIGVDAKTRAEEIISAARNGGRA